MCSDECGACVLRNRELSYEDEILLNDDLSESSLAYAVPRDSENREAQGAESSAKFCPDLSSATTFDIADLRLAFQIHHCRK